MHACHPTENISIDQKKKIDTRSSDPRKKPHPIGEVVEVLDRKMGMVKNHHRCRERAQKWNKGETRVFTNLLYKFLIRRLRAAHRVAHQQVLNHGAKCVGVRSDAVRIQWANQHAGLSEPARKTAVLPDNPESLSSHLLRQLYEHQRIRNSSHAPAKHNTR